MLYYLFTLFFALGVAAAPANFVLEQRQPADGIQCGDTIHSQRNLDRAFSFGCCLDARGLQLGANKYPHNFANHENLDFLEDDQPVEGPYREFPVLRSGQLYTGGAPGPDRVVFKQTNGGCQYIGAMTHTGAVPRNAFVLCVPPPPLFGA
ncbi:Ribonuclease/ribotoxin [Parathielavia appendiculata]|uniref:Ribonuclease/ribotoxin n=1 Tax=Parathielavia appendiculata TaxID=2587402 RepID=A0AAN6TUB6_9PEZI|nr:Ribonuclease/ribotoxin [Parathielavia appendiculata]